MTNYYPYSSTNASSLPRQHKAHEKLWLRKNLEEGDAKWADLSPAARGQLLRTLKVAPRLNVNNQPLTLETQVPADLAAELQAAGFLAARVSLHKNYHGRCWFVPAARQEVVRRMQHLYQLGLLAKRGPTMLLEHLNLAWRRHETQALLNQILLRGGIGPVSFPLEEQVPRFVLKRYWLDWAAQDCGSPAVDQVLKEIKAAREPLRLEELTARMPTLTAAQVRVAIESLVARLAVLEGLRSETWELVVGLHPNVREDLDRAAQAGQRLALPPAVAVVEHSPEAGVVVDDLRTILLEVAQQPPRTKQNGQLFQKEVDRFSAALTPLPEWVEATCTLTAADRLNIAYSMAQNLHLLAEREEEMRQFAFHITPAGYQWLASGLAQQFLSVYENMRSLETASPYERLTHDSRFLGIDVLALPLGKNQALNLWSIAPALIQALRQSLYQALRQLPVGEFRPLEQVLAFLVQEETNPLLLGQTPAQVAVLLNQLRIIPLADELSRAAHRCFDALCRIRLTPLGAVQLGKDAQGRLCVAPTPRLAAYFGEKLSVQEWGGGPSAAPGKVVVQPDFSILILGQDPRPLADLASFCERTGTPSGQGAVQLKLTRAAVLKAVAGGLSGEEILTRLERHASHALPGNVRHEVKEWSGWVRTIRAETVVLLRCPDRVTVDRLVAVLGSKRVERLTDTLASVRTSRLSATDRQKLRKEGLILEDGSSSAPQEMPPLRRPSRY